MKRVDGKRWLGAMGLAVMLAVSASGQQVAAQTGTVPVGNAPKPERVIFVSLEDRKLALVEDGQVKKVYTVAVGKPSTPSPEGVFTIARRVRNPVYQHDGRTVQPGPGNPVGTRWMGLSIRGYGIHGTNEPKSIGKAASHGCIRMAKADLEEFYEMVEVGDKVELVGHRDQETIALFGPEPVIKPSVPAGTTQTATAEPAVAALPKIEAQPTVAAGGSR
jgi:lipoprotein-anchoring transpeptidase ErfK/SrfK